MIYKHVAATPPFTHDMTALAAMNQLQSYVAMAYTLLRERLGPEQLATVMDPALMKQLEVNTQQQGSG
jgi:hypothetical protein